MFMVDSAIQTNFRSRLRIAYCVAKNIVDRTLQELRVRQQGGVLPRAGDDALACAASKFASSTAESGE
jgi:hypothetical protein